MVWGKPAIHFVNKNNSNAEIFDRTNINFSWNFYGNRVGIIKSYMTIGSSTFRRRVYQGESVTLSRNDTPFWNMTPVNSSINQNGGYNTYGFRYGTDQAVFLMGTNANNSASTDLRVRLFRANSGDTSWPTNTATTPTNASRMLARFYDPSTNKIYGAGSTTSDSIRVATYNGTSLINASNQTYPAIMGDVEVGKLTSTPRTSPTIVQSHIVKAGNYVYHISSSRVFAYNTSVDNNDTGLTSAARWKVIHWGSSSINTMSTRFSSVGDQVTDLKSHVATKPDGSVSVFRFPSASSGDSGDFRYTTDGYSMKTLNLKLFTGCPDLSSSTSDLSSTNDVIWSTIHNAFILIKQGIIWASTDGINWYPRKIQSIYSNASAVDTLHLINTNTKLISVVNAHDQNGFYIYESVS
jgi:hypothetical protein